MYLSKVISPKVVGIYSNATKGPFPFLSMHSISLMTMKKKIKIGVLPQATGNTPILFRGKGNKMTSSEDWNNLKCLRVTTTLKKKSFQIDFSHNEGQLIKNSQRVRQK